MLEDALWLHECCKGLVLGRKQEQGNLVSFCVKWLQPTMTGTSRVWQVQLRSNQCAMNQFLLFVPQQVASQVCVADCVFFGRVANIIGLDA